MRSLRFTPLLVLLVICCCRGQPTDDEGEKKRAENTIEDVPEAELKTEQENDVPQSSAKTSTFINGCHKRNCKELYNAGYKISGVYCIDPDGQGSFLVYCDMVTNGGGWTSIQRRLDGKVNFYREWDCYKDGFGNIYAEHWLGLEKIRRMTSQKNFRLRVDLRDTNGNARYAEYSYFAIASESLKYRLNLGSYSGNAGDSLSYHSHQSFTTKDRDNDAYSLNCAVRFKGAWWYKSCHYSNLNGQYLGPGPHSSYADGVNWRTWKGYYYSMKRAEMKIRPA